MAPIGSSPHTRGALVRVANANYDRRIIPAYAGSTGRRRRQCPGHRDHPRIRGEHAPSPRGRAASSGSSPHTRGAPLDVQARLTRGGIIPAYAGSTQPADRRGRQGGGSSPHTRGAHDSRRDHCRHLRIIPAYAGSTSPHPWFPLSGTDHPRIRGEHGGAEGIDRTV